MNEDILDDEPLTRAQSRRLWYHTPQAVPYVMSPTHVSRRDKRKVLLSHLRMYKRRINGARSPLPGVSTDTLRSRRVAFTTIRRFEDQRVPPSTEGQASMQYIKESLGNA